MEMLIGVCELIMALTIVVIVGIGLRQEYLTWNYGEKFEEHTEYRRLTAAGYIVGIMGLITTAVYIVGLFI